MPGARSASICLDAFALLAWLQDEPGAAVVERHLSRAEGGSAECAVSIINVGEVFYRLSRLRSPEEAEQFWKDTRRRVVPVRVVEATSARVRAAARWKARYAISYADAFALQTAVEFRATLVTGDPELRAIEGRENVQFEWLPQR